MRSWLRTLPPVLTAALVLASCGVGEGGDDGGEERSGEAATASSTEGPVRVVATTSILGDIVGELVGDDGEVVVLMGPGVDPHGYAPSARDAAALQDADLVVANGLRLEEPLLDALEAAEEVGVAVFEMAPRLDPLAFGEDADTHDDHDHDHADDTDDGHDHADDGDHAGHDHGPEDPHVWFDPDRMARGVELLGAQLAEVAPQVDAAEWERRAATYADELRRIDGELAAAFEAVPADRRILVTNHEALGYLAARYDLEVLGTVIPGTTTQVETDPRAFTELIEVLEQHQVRTIFADNTDDTRLAEQLARETRGRGDLEVEVVEVTTDALGEPGTPTATYLGLLRETGTTIAERLAAERGK